MSAVITHLEKVGYFDWSAFLSFSAEQKAQAVKILRQAAQHVERLTLNQSIAQAAEELEIADESVWTAYHLIWQQIRDGDPHSERQLMKVIGQYESDQGWSARACRELIRNAIDAYHTTRIDRHVAEFEVGRFEAAEAGIYAQVVPQVATGKLSLADAALHVEHNQAGT